MTHIVRCVNSNHFSFKTRFLLIEKFPYLHLFLLPDLYTANKSKKDFFKPITPPQKKKTKNCHAIILMMCCLFLGGHGLSPRLFGLYHTFGTLFAARENAHHHRRRRHRRSRRKNGCEGGRACLSMAWKLGGEFSTTNS